MMSFLNTIRMDGLSQRENRYLSFSNRVALGNVAHYRIPSQEDVQRHDDMDNFDNDISNSQRHSDIDSVDNGISNGRHHGDMDSFDDDIPNGRHHDDMDNFDNDIPSGQHHDD